MANHVSIRRDTFRELIEHFPERQRLAARAFWVESLMRANWRDGEDSSGRDTLALKRGQFPMGREEMAAFLGVSVQTLRTIMARFETLSELTTKTTNRGTVATVVKYDLYVCDGN